MFLKYDENDIVSLKKGHPCGENLWRIVRKGADMKLRCEGCGRDIWMTRMDFEKRVRKIMVGDKLVKIRSEKLEEQRRKLAEKMEGRAINEEE